MTLDNIVFIDSLPTIDVHGYDRDSARVAINDFVNDNVKMKREAIAIIHGIGTGILKEETRNVLSNNSKVVDFRVWYRNQGLTVALLNLTK